MKTIFMRKEDFNKWITALRSGKYKKGKGRLSNILNTTYCCLGVLEHCLTGEVESCNIPSWDWLYANKIQFLDKEGNQTLSPTLDDASAWWWNDDRDATFDQIADLLEKHFQATDE